MVCTWRGNMLHMQGSITQRNDDILLLVHRTLAVHAPAWQAIYVSQANTHSTHTRPITNTRNATRPKFARRCDQIDICVFVCACVCATLRSTVHTTTPPPHSHPYRTRKARTETLSRRVGWRTFTQCTTTPRATETGRLFRFFLSVGRLYMMMGLCGSFYVGGQRTGICVSILHLSHTHRDAHTNTLMVNPQKRTCALCHE